jgi:hypothetical protein
MRNQYCATGRINKKILAIELTNTIRKNNPSMERDFAEGCAKAMIEQGVYVYSRKKLDLVRATVWFAGA